MTARESARASAETATFEHVRPKSKGGTHSLDNLVLTCYACNAKRANSDELRSHDSIYMGQLDLLCRRLEQAYQEDAIKQAAETVRRFRQKYGRELFDV